MTVHELCLPSTNPFCDTIFCVPPEMLQNIILQICMLFGADYHEQFLYI